MAGELDVATSAQLRQALDEAQLEARLVVLDLRELTFIDSCGVDAILNAARNARRDARRLMVAGGAAHIDRVLTLAGATANVWILDLDLTEPAPALRPSLNSCQSAAGATWRS